MYVIIIIVKTINRKEIGMKKINNILMSIVHILEKIIAAILMVVVVIAVLLACRKFLFLDDDLKKVTNRKMDK